MDKRRNYEELEDLILSDEVSTRIENAVAQAEADLPDLEVRVNFRWTKRPLDLVKEAASIMGIPYQGYLKLVVVREALADIKAAREAGAAPLGDDRNAPQNLRVVGPRG